MDAAIAALAGTVIGAAIPAIAGWIQRSQQSRSELLRDAVQLGSADYALRSKQMEAMGGGSMPPVVLFIAHHANALRSIRDGKMSPEEVHRLGEAADELMKAYAERAHGVRR